MRLNQNVSIKINDEAIEQLKYTKFLGLYINDERTWKYHLDHVATKISKMTGIMAKARDYLSLVFRQFMNPLFTRT